MQFSAKALATDFLNKHGYGSLYSTSQHQVELLYRYAAPLHFQHGNAMNLAQSVMCW